jgi:hypothetical protein
MDYGQRLTHIVDAAFQLKETDDPLRTHLGASVIGEKCMRRVWFHWLWACIEPFDGRMLRLFDRGDREEAQFTRLLQYTGAEVWTTDKGGNQFRVSALGGHFGGSLDGVARNLPNLPHYIPNDTPCLTEFKTHNEKSFKLLLTDGLQTSKPKHFKQAQVYMHLANLKFCLYCAVNKNDDALWFHLFPYDSTVGTALLNRAETIIFGDGIPPRISETPTWFECRFCPAKGVCFKTEKPLVNCRTCVHSQPLREGGWRCELKQPEIETEPRKGCKAHKYNPELC